MSDQNTGFAGLPAGMPAPTHDARTERASLGFDLPESLTRGLSWRDTPKEWLSYRMAELTPQEQGDALRLAGNPPNPSVLLMECIFKVVVELGGTSTRGRRDDLDRWWKALGPKGRKFVEASFMHLSSPTEEEVASFLVAGKP